MRQPENAARKKIDAALLAAGWVVQDYDDLDLDVARGVIVREFPLAPGFGFADYLLYVDGEACGVLEAKREGTSLTGVEMQSEKYSNGLPDHLPARIRPLPFLYLSTGIETTFANGLDPGPRSRNLFHFHRPETLARWLEAEPIGVPLTGAEPEPRSELPATLRSRLQAMPSVEPGNLWPAQIKAVRSLEKSFYADRPRALIQMATGSGKTFTAITSIYRLIKFGGAERVLFLVDRSNLGTQALKEFQQFTTPDDGRKLTELYNVQLLTSNKLDPVARVVITTIQRLYSMLKGESELAPGAEETSQFVETLADLRREPLPVGYNAALPIELFDVVFIDECHRSIYTLWRQVLEYFDAYLVGLTATPSSATYGFFEKNLVMEYGHADAVADGVNVDFDVYKIRTRITEQGATMDAGPLELVGRRDRETRAMRWERLDEDLTYDGDALDHTVVSEDQIRTVVRTFRDKLFTEIFPGRTEVPKTLVFAKSDSHADDIVKMIRKEFGKGNDFCQKITYKTGTARVVTKTVGEDGTERETFTFKSTDVKAEDLLSSFRNSYDPRIVVTVDMIATGTDVKPLEIVMFMRAVKSRTFFEQMKGRGVRVIKSGDMSAVTPDARGKDRFVLVDCVGVCETALVDSLPLERNRTVGLEKLLDAVKAGSTDRDLLTSLAGRLARIDRRIGPDQRHTLTELAGGRTLGQIAHALVDALNLDRQIDQARTMAGLPPEAQPTPAQVDKAAKVLLTAALAPLRASKPLRERLADVQKDLEQAIDATTMDTVIEARQAPEIKQRIAEQTVQRFEEFLAKHKDEITALQVLYSKPYRQRLRGDDVKALAAQIQAPPRSWTPDALWRAYETLRKDKVRGSGAQRLITDVVSLVRFALHQDDELIPYADKVSERFAAWLLQQETGGRKSTEEQWKWLVAIRDHVAANMEVEMDDLGYVPFNALGGVGKAYKLFGPELGTILDELNEALAA